LRALFTGSEGTLRTITEITLKLLAKPKFARTALATFDRIDDAAQAVNAVMQSGLLPTSAELLDNFTLRCIEEHAPIGLPLDADAVLLFGTDANDEDIVNAETAAIGEIARAHAPHQNRRRSRRHHEPGEDISRSGRHRRIPFVSGGRPSAGGCTSRLVAV
jgi:FAD/FMN-containing dehydrogenase